MLNRKQNLGAINIHAMSDEQNWILSQFLNAQSEQLKDNPDLALVAKNIVHTIKLKTEDGLIEFSFRLDNDILIRELEHAPDEYCFEVISNSEKIGAGAFGEVIKIEATLVTEEDQLVFQQNNSPHLIKIQKHSEEHPKHRAEDEYVQTGKTPYIHMKKPVFIKTGENEWVSYMVMHQLNDFGLENIILEKGIFNSEFFSALPVDEVIELSILLCLGLDEQVHLNNIIHRDITPANILTTKDFSNIYFLDFAFALDANKNNTEEISRGNLDYLAPEVMDNQASKASDMFSLMLTIADLFKIINNRDEFEERDQQIKFIKQPPLDLECIWEGISPYSEDLAQDHKQKIYDLLKKGVHLDPARRPLAEEAVEVFETIRLERLFTQLNINDNKKRQSIIDSNKAARKVRRELYLSQKDSNVSFATVCDLIKKSLEQVNGEFEINQFVYRVGIQAFRQLTSKKEILNALDEINSAINANNRLLIGLNERLAELRKDGANEQIVKQVDSMMKNILKEIDRFSKKAANIDELVKLNKHVSQLVPKLASSIYRIEIANKTAHFLQTDLGKEANEVANFLMREAKDSGHTLIERKNLRKEFLQAIAMEKPEKREQAIIQDKMANLIEFFAIRLLPDAGFCASFKKLAVATLNALTPEEKSDDSIVLKQLQATLDFSLMKIKLIDIFSTEIEQLENMHSNQLQNKIDSLESTLSCIEQAYSVSELKGILAINELKPFLRDQYTFGIYKKPNPFKKKINAFQDNYLIGDFMPTFRFER